MPKKQGGGVLRPVYKNCNSVFFSCLTTYIFN
jgi:hypothetical protein